MKRKMRYKNNLRAQQESSLFCGVLGFDSWRGLGIFLFSTVSRTDLGPTQPPIQWVPQALFLGIKRPGREADHSPPSSADVKNAWSYTSTPPIRLHVVVLSSALGIGDSRTVIRMRRVLPPLPYTSSWRGA
jgi:hypothetical protein